MCTWHEFDAAKTGCFPHKHFPQNNQRHQHVKRRGLASCDLSCNLGRRLRRLRLSTKGMKTRRVSTNTAGNGSGKKAEKKLVFVTHTCQTCQVGCWPSLPLWGIVASCHGRQGSVFRSGIHPNLTGFMQVLFDTHLCPRRMCEVREDVT